MGAPWKQGTRLDLRDATIIDPATRQVVPTASILVDHGRIVAIYRQADQMLSGRPAHVVDCAGKFVLPGLIDAHVHLKANPHRGPSQDDPVPAVADASDGPKATADHVRRLHTFLYTGVTSLYDAGNDPNVIFDVRGLERSGAIVAPRVFCSGRLITSPGGHGAQVGAEIASADDVERVVRDHLAHGPDLVKITYDEHNWGVRPLISILERDVLTRIIDAVHAAGLRVAVHVSNELRAREAVDSGADVLAHPVIQSPVTDEFVRLLAERQIPVVSTLAIGERYFRLADQPDCVDRGLYAECESAAERTRLRMEESLYQRANRWADWMRVMTPVAQENLRMLVAAGGVVAAGTDLSFGPDVHRELDLLQGAGIAPMDVIGCATRGGALVLGRSGELGSMAEGAAADLLVVDADPTRDVRNLSAISWVIKAGRLVDRSALDVPVNRAEEAACPSTPV